MPEHMYGLLEFKVAGFVTSLMLPIWQLRSTSQGPWRAHSGKGTHDKAPAHKGGEDSTFACHYYSRSKRHHWTAARSNTSGKLTLLGEHIMDNDCSGS